jgi:hypothetical protein
MMTLGWLRSSLSTGRRESGDIHEVCGSKLHIRRKIPLKKSGSRDITTRNVKIISGEKVKCLFSFPAIIANGANTFDIYISTGRKY